jgi:hypothetical protein
MVMKRHIICLALAVAMTLAAAPAYCGSGYVLLLDRTPVDGGIVTPGAGVHSYDTGQMVTVTAVPKPGYQFIRWMGDVSVVDTGTTTIKVDSPKLVVAVFEKLDYALTQVPSQFDTGGGGTDAPGEGSGGGGAVRQSWAIGNNSGVSPASPTTEYSNSNSYPNPTTNPNVPIPTPEPATIAMIGLGAAIQLLRRRRQVS